MARWFVCALFFLQVCLVVLGEDTTTTLQSPPNSSSSSSSESTKMQETEPSETATRAGHKSSTPMPSLVHNSLNATSQTPNKTTETKNKNVDNKNAALSVYSCSQIVIVSLIGVLLSISAI